MSVFINFSVAIPTGLGKEGINKEQEQIACEILRKLTNKPIVKVYGKFSYDIDNNQWNWPSRTFGLLINAEVLDVEYTTNIFKDLRFVIPYNIIIPRGLKETIE